MESDILLQFINYFNDFLSICQSEHWPLDGVTQVEINNAFEVSKHIEKCISTLQKNGFLEQFLSCLNLNQTMSALFVKKYCLDPSRCILEKILCSEIQNESVNLAFNIFMQLFGETRLEDSLTNILTETASVGVLWKNLSNEMCKESLIKVKSGLFFCICNINNSDNFILNMLKHSNENTVEIIIMCLLNHDSETEATRTKVKSAFIKVMSSKDIIYKDFWRKLFKIDIAYLKEVCIEHGDIFQLILKALIDCSKIIQEDMCGEFFYVDLSYIELSEIVQKLCSDNDLKDALFCSILESNQRIEFWDNLLKNQV